MPSVAAGGAPNGRRRGASRVFRLPPQRPRLGDGRAGLSTHHHYILRFQINATWSLIQLSEFITMMQDVHIVERGSSAVECRTRNRVSSGSNPALLPFRRLGIFVLSIDAPVDSAV